MKTELPKTELPVVKSDKPICLPHSEINNINIENVVKTKIELNTTAKNQAVSEGKDMPLINGNGVKSTAKIELTRCDTSPKVDSKKVQQFYENVKCKLEYVAETREESDDILFTGEKLLKKRKQIPKVKTENIIKDSAAKDTDIQITDESGPTPEGLFRQMQKLLNG